MKPTDYEILFDLPEGEYSPRAIGGIRTVTYRAGDSLEVMCHPITNLTPEARREARARRTRPAMRIVNQRNRERQHLRIIEANFTGAAFVLTLTYPYPFEDPGLVNLDDMTEAYDRRGLPWDYEDVKRDWDNYIRKVKRLMLKRGHKGRALKWDRVIEEHKNQPMPGLPHHMHIHALIEAPDITRDELEDMWLKGKVTKCRRFDRSDDGAARLARYMTKNGRDASEGGPAGGRRWWTHSRNLKIPQPRTSDRKISRRRVAKIAADVQHHGAEIFERLYPGYRVMELPTVRYSDFVAGVYIYCRMRRRD